ncbi:MAG TPA: alpha/beta fold hydrolase [Candidatus Polarisedimenticolia bacterium]|jgi:pimeloyl-ACP methyl ester carboxylesterase|nr:alpha/beta fold hydrolase [Candidatus Polarisedimenticolia bacterium]
MPEEVVLLHGLGRTWRSMRPVARALRRAGFVTHNIGYPSRRHRLPVLAELVAERIARARSADPGGRPGEAAPRRPPHFVGHSLGCILIRYLLAHRPELRGGRVVLLTPPNQGARAADVFQPYVSWLLRPLPDLSVGGGIAAGLVLPPGVEVGLIAGGTDRTVRLHETRLDGAADSVIVPCGHSFIMLRRDAQDLTVRFLKTGRFSP